MSGLLQVRRITCQIGASEGKAILLNQKEINIKVKEEGGFFLLIDAADCREMFILASLFQYVLNSHNIVFLEREEVEFTDLFIFNGAINPLTAKKAREIKRSIKNIVPEIAALPIINSHQDSFWDKFEHWKYKKQIRIHADKDLALLNASQLGLELLYNCCTHLATSYSGHVHLDWYSTKSSPELIIRNIARN